MIFIDLESNPPKQDWIDRADILTQSLVNATDSDIRDKIINDNAKMWGELKDHLAGLSYNKCWYSESRNDGSHCHVDHFRPKSEAIDESKNDLGGYWWLAFEWRNYRYSGPAANVRKKAYFHVNANKANNYGDSIEAEDIRFLDPTEIDDPGKLSYDIDGQIHPKSSDSTDRAYVQAEYTIRRMNLNHEPLKEGRRNCYREATLRVKQIDKLLNQQTTSFDQARKIKINGLMKELWRMCCKDALYSATVKYCLRSTTFEWASDIVANAA